MKIKDYDSFVNEEILNENLVVDYIKNIGSEIYDKLKVAFEGDVKKSIQWLKKMVSSGVSIASISLIISSVSSCSSPDKLLRTYTNPNFISKMKKNDPKYFKYIYYESKDSTGKVEYKIRKKLLHDPSWFGKEPNESYRGKSCLMGGHCPTYD